MTPSSRPAAPRSSGHGATVHIPPPVAAGLVGVAGGVGGAGGALRARVQQAQGDMMGAESSRARAQAVIAGQAVAPELRAELRE